jgi:hypothetical protein
MLMCVAREKSPIGSDEATRLVCYLPQGEKAGPAAALLLPGRDPAVFFVYAERPPGPDGHPPTERNPVMTPTELTGVVAEHIAAINAQDTDAIMATFAEDAYVNDARREFAGLEAIRRWVAKEITGDKISIDVREVLDHHGDTIVRGAYDGQFDKTNLPDELILSNYFSIRDGKIASLIIVSNQPASY